MKKIRKIIREAFVDAEGNIEDLDYSNDLEENIIDSFLRDLIKKYNVKGRIIGSSGSPFAMEYVFPFESIEDLRHLGVPYEIERITNKEHNDYGKRVAIVTWKKI